MPAKRDIDKRAFFEAADKQLPNNEEVSVQCPLNGDGFLVCIDETCAIVADEFDDVYALPTYIKTLDDAQAYIKDNQRIHRRGREAGRIAFKRELAMTMGMVTKEDFERRIDGLERSIEQLSERID